MTGVDALSEPTKRHEVSSDRLTRPKSKGSGNLEESHNTPDQRPKLFKEQPLVDHMGRTPVRRWIIKDKDGNVLSFDYVGIVDFDKLLFEETDWDGNPTGNWLNLRHLGGWEVKK